MATTTNLSSLVINYLTQAQYDAAAEGGTINENQLYFTPPEQMAAVAKSGNYNDLNNKPTIPDVNELKILVIELESFSSLPQTITNSAITADHVCIGIELSKPWAQGDWTITTSDGSLTISGSISEATTATLYLAVEQ